MKSVGDAATTMTNHKSEVLQGIVNALYAISSSAAEIPELQVWSEYFATQAKVLRTLMPDDYVAAVAETDQQPGKQILPSQLAKLLRYAADLIDQDDSYEGRIEWTFGTEAPNFTVHAAVREGNSMGQGGMLII